MKIALAALLLAFVAPPPRPQLPQQAARQRRAQVDEPAPDPRFDPRWPPNDAHSLDHREFYSAFPH